MRKAQVGNLWTRPTVMALLNSLFCCELFTGGVFVGIYTMVTYLGAFIMELWWIIDLNIQLPPPAYLLAAGYFLSFLVSLFLLAGLFLKKSRYLLGWLIVAIFFFFPECGLALYMSLRYWGLQDEYSRGLCEFAFYICRATINVLCIICVHSLYSQWKQEKAVMRRLENLNVVTSFRELGSTVTKENGDTGASHYVNLPSHYADTEPTYIVAHNSALKRSCSSASNLIHARSLASCGALTKSEQDIYGSRSSTPGQAYWNTGRSEFDASSFSEYVSTRIRSQQHSPAVYANGVNHREYRPVHPPTRTASDLHTYYQVTYHEREKSKNNNPHKSQCNGQITHVDYSTQSLDRPKFKRPLKHQRSHSLEELNVRGLGDVTLEKLPERPFEYLERPGSRFQNDSETSSNHSIRDIAL